ncbi:NADH dehydrogenase subunit I [Desulfonispora thiosulfatigenes DSM 11270]|uniref:NADH dehydrogenase subunit I n=1 Tax=Desulfonispora thiosulfatigenes DSM 11270 TaxID=656914 RepID=A0A1W1VKK6_DESTI|nr:NADH-quinone oxidoreductase subunit I [Desulfonispora thiosulfatigenes]SMB93909.1 NADH dehydrogenase subunit I [Desulfonispora thiosulfatigenes DSM 11270]
MRGKGLLKGLGVTGKAIFSKRVTEEYPDVMPDIASRWRGLFRLDIDKCISCGMCVRACPNEVIKITTEMDENKKRKLSGYEMNLSYCLWCGMCVEACPTHCLRHTKDFETATFFKDEVTLDLFNRPNLSAPVSTFGQPDKEKEEKAKAEKEDEK